MSAEGMEAAEQDESRRRVLVAEDGTMFRTAVIRLLKEAGFEIEAVPDGTVALKRLVGPGSREFDLLISDIAMPTMSGLELVRRMREELSEPPAVIYMSGDVAMDLGTEPGAIGGDVILAKPFGPEELLAAISSALD
jgi:two-component system chemotaxis response regulator CheY